MNYTNSKIAGWLFVILISIYSCTDSTIPGVAVKPSGDNLNLVSVDTSTITSEVVLEDSLLSDETTYNLLGIYNDPVFGLAKAGFYSEFALGTDTFAIGEGFKVDSVVLFMACSGSYGDWNIPQNVKIFELNENIFRDQNYYSTTKFSSDKEIADVSIMPATEIKLRLSGLESKFQDIKSENISDAKSFSTFFKGLYASPVNAFSIGQGAIMYFNLQSPLSKLRIYYKNVKKDSLICDLIVTDQCARINHFYHDYSKTLIEKAVSNVAFKDSLIYLQAMAGTKAKIRIPFISSYSNKGYIVNKAELVITVDESTVSTNFTPSSRLFIRGTGDNGEMINIADEAVGTAYYGGGYNSGTKQYKFNIGKHMQGIFNGTTKNVDLQLVVGDNNTSGSRVVVFGGNRIKLLLTYTKI